MCEATAGHDVDLVEASRAQALFPAGNFQLPPADNYKVSDPAASYAPTRRSRKSGSAAKAK